MTSHFDISAHTPNNDHKRKQRICESQGNLHNFYLWG